MERRTLAGLAIIAACVGGSARAQLLPPSDSLVQFNKYTAVRERVTPGYSPVDIIIGSFSLTPSLDVTGEYNDNIYALQKPRVADEFIDIAPSVGLTSTSASRSLSLNASGRLDRYVSHPSENTEEVDVSAFASQQLGSGTRVRLITRYHQDRESRESENAYVLTQRPVRYETAAVALGVSQRFASLLILGEGGIQHSNYFNAALADGTPVDQHFRNNDLKSVRFRAEVAQSPSLAYFAQATQQWVDYRAADSGGGSRNLELLGGVRFELPIRARGEIGAGYVRAKSDGIANTFSGIAVNSKVIFFPTDLLTVTVNAQRSVNNAGTPTRSGYVALSGSVQADYELLRNLILGANVEFERDTFNGFDRRDRRVAGGVNAEYRLSSGWAIRASYDVLDLSSTGVARYKSFSRNRAQLGLRFYL